MSFALRETLREKYRRFKKEFDESNDQGRVKRIADEFAGIDRECEAAVKEGKLSVSIPGVISDENFEKFKAQGLTLVVRRGHFPTCDSLHEDDGCSTITNITW